MIKKKQKLWWNNIFLDVGVENSDKILINFVVVNCDIYLNLSLIVDRFVSKIIKLSKLKSWCEIFEI